MRFSIFAAACVVLATTPREAAAQVNNQQPRPPAAAPAATPAPRAAAPAAPAATPAPRPAIAAPAASAAKPADPVAQSYAALPEAERIAIQNDLIWSGDYNGTAGAEFGARAIAAVKAFQKRSGAKDTGTLTAKERADLAAAARRKREAVGWRVVEDGTTGVRIGIPSKLAPQAAAVIGGYRWTAAKNEVQVETFRIAAQGTTLQSVFDRYSKIPNRKASYTLVRPTFFVLSGLQAGVKKFYVRGEFKNNEVRGFTILYDQAVQEAVDPVVIAMSSAFAAYPAAPAVAAGPPPRKKVEYGTAVFVDAAGNAVTTQNLVDGCNVVTLAGYGPADVVASDKAANLALLRVYGASGLTPIGLSAGGGAAALVGVADPQAQGGGAAISVRPVQAKAGEQSASVVLDPAPALGFEGAATVDAAGRLAGIVDLPLPVIAGPPAAPPQAKLIPVAAIRTFLTAQKVTAGDEARSGEAQKAAVTRVTCVRK